MAVINSYSIFATGGAVMLFFTTASTGTITLTRTSQTTNLPIILYSGPPLRTDGFQSIYLDTGDDDTVSASNPSGTVLSKFLDQTQLYVYTLTDTNGSTATPALQPITGTLLAISDVVPTFMKLLQVALQSATPPTGIAKAYVSFAPPEATFQQLPYIAIFPSKFDQADQPIGADVELVDDDNVWTLYEQALFEITVSMFFKDSTELLFYRDRTLAYMRFIRAEYFSPLGVDSSHMYTSESHLIVQPNAKAPSLLRCDVKFQFKGQNECSIQRNWGLIEHIDAIANDSETGDKDVEVIIP